MTERGVLLEAAAHEAMTALMGRSPDATVAGALGDEDDGPVLWDVPEIAPAAGDHAYVWMAGEAGVMKRLRRAARFDLGLPRSSVACMGYWRRGAAEPE